MQEDINLELVEETIEMNQVNPIEMGPDPLEPTADRPVYTGTYEPNGDIPKDCIRWEVVYRKSWESCEGQYRAKAGIVSSNSECQAAIANAIANLHPSDVVCSTACDPAVCWG